METQVKVKERLTGAVILVALVVLLVPELLTGPGKPAATSRAAEPAMRSYTVDLAEGSGRQRATPIAVESEPLEASVVAPSPEPRPMTKPAPAVSGTKPVATAPEAAPPPPAPARIVEPPVTGWSVQLGSFQSRDNAQRLVKELKGKGFGAFILEGGGRSGKLYRVRVGPVADRTGAAALAAKLREAGQPGSIVPHP